jgi:hypothetical protein
MGGSVLGAEDLDESMPAFDFTKPGQVAGWEATHDIVRIDSSEEGMVVWIGGGDPYHVFRRHGMILHAAGAIERIREHGDGVGFNVRPWMARPSWVLVNGVSRVPVVRMDGRELELRDPHEYDAKTGRLVLQVKGPARIELGY